MSVQKVNSDGSTTLLAGSTLWADSPIGTILAYGGANSPSGWMLCQGQAVSRTTYAELFSVIGTAFGVGDGSTTFNLPDMRESVPKGAGLTGKTVGAHLDADGLAVGEFLDDRLQDLQIKSSENTSEVGAWANDTVIRGYVGNTLQVRSLHYMSPDNTTNRFGATTEVKSVGVNYIIKAKMVALPSDLEAGVDEKIAEVTADTTAYTAAGDVSKAFGALRTVHVPSGVTQREAFYSIVGAKIIYNQNNNSAYVIGHWGVTPINKISIFSGTMTLYNGDTAVTTLIWNNTTPTTTEFRLIGVPYAD